MFFFIIRTDRILFHSLPDLRGHLKLLYYGMCENILGSDHRPVSAALQLTFFKVNDDLLALSPDNPSHVLPSPPQVTLDHISSYINGNEKDGEMKFSPAGDVNGSYLLDQHEVEGEGHYHASYKKSRADQINHVPSSLRFQSWRRNRTFTCKITDFIFDTSGAADPSNLRILSLIDTEVVAGGAEPPPGTLALNKTESSYVSSSGGSKGGGGVIPRVPSLRKSESSGGGAGGSMVKSEVVTKMEDQIESVVVLMPIPCEDPFMADRRVVLLEMYSAAGTNGSTSTMHETGQHVHRLPWTEVQTNGIRVTATVLNGMGLHAVLKLVDKHGTDLGQSCLCLGGLFRKSREQRIQCGSSKVQTRMELPLSVGGVFKGKVSFDISLREKRGHG